MRHLEFAQDVLDEIRRDRFEHPDAIIQQRMEALWLRAHGEKHERIAEIAGVSRTTVHRILSRYRSGGLAAVRTLNWHTPQSALAPHRLALEAEFRLRPPATVAEACSRIEQLTGIRRSPTLVRHFLRQRLGMRWRKTGAVPLPPRKSVAEHAAQQAAFLK